MSSNPKSSNSEHVPPSDTDRRPAVSGEELLPPVEPPDAGFLLQLFVFPALIVLAIVLLWLLLTTLATRDDRDPQKIVAVLRSSNPARWQKADELATMLRLPERYPELKRNKQLATELAKLLEEEVDAQHEDESSIKLRYFLCRLVGELWVEDGLPVLLKTAREDVERDVRREAINALAVLGDALANLTPPVSLEHPDLVKTFVRLAGDKDDLIRSQTAFTLGVLSSLPGADPQLLHELELLVEDLYSDARYNAALGLARQGNLKAVEAVIEMLDPEALAATIARETDPALKAYKRNTILRNAIDAADQLLKSNPALPLDELIAAIQKFVDTADTWDVAGNVPKVLIDRGRAVLEQSGRR